MRPLDLGSEPFHAAVGAKGERDQHPRVRWPAEQPAEELDGRRVGPVEVVEDQDEWPRRREPLQQPTHRAMGAVALEREWCATATTEPGQRGEDVRELGSVLGIQQIEDAGVEAADVVVEGVDEHPEGKVPLQLGRRARRARAPRGDPRAA